MKISLGQQIEEVERELKERERVYAGIARKSPRDKSRLDYQVERMRAVLATLKWLHENEPMIKQRLE